MIQLGQLSLFVMAQLASRLPFQSAYVPLHWTYQLNSFRKKKKKSQRGGKERENKGIRKEGAVEGKKWNKECSNNHIIHLNAEANYRDKCDFFVLPRILVVVKSDAEPRSVPEWLERCFERRSDQ